MNPGGTLTDKQARTGEGPPDDIETVHTDPSSENAAGDVQSDPSGGKTWSDEGGATTQGPATDPHSR